MVDMFILYNTRKIIDTPEINNFPRMYVDMWTLYFCLKSVRWFVRVKKRDVFAMQTVLAHGDKETW